MSNIEEEMMALTNEGQWGGKPLFTEIKEISVNGKTGDLVIESYDRELKTRVADVLGKSVSVCLIRKRSKLIRSGDVFLVSDEFDRNEDFVNLRGKGTQHYSGTVEQLKKEFPDLKRQEVFYAIDMSDSEFRLIKILFKGSSLGSKDTNITNRLYSYLSDFSSNNEHVWQYKTIIQTEKAGEYTDENTGELVPYFAITCTKSARIDDAIIAEQIIPKARDIAAEIDRANARVIANVKVSNDFDKIDNKPTNSNQQDQKEEDIPIIEFVEEDKDKSISFEELPF